MLKKIFLLIIERDLLVLSPHQLRVLLLKGKKKEEVRTYLLKNLNWQVPRE